LSVPTHSCKKKKNWQKGSLFRTS